jgi:hypothetical protein
MPSIAPFIFRRIIMPKDSSHFTRKDYLLLVSPFLTVALLTALVSYSVRSTVGDAPNFLVTLALSIAAGVVVFCAAFLGNDLFQRWDYAARALHSIRKGCPEERLHGVQDLHASGKQSVFYMQSVRQGAVRGFLAAFTRWEEGFVLRHYVLPGLQAAAHDRDTTVRQCAMQALNEIDRP